MALASTPFGSIMDQVRDLEQQFVEKVNVHFVWLAELKEEIKREFSKPGVDLLPKTPSAKRNRYTKRNKPDLASPSKAPATGTRRVTRSRVGVTLARVVDDTETEDTTVERASSRASGQGRKRTKRTVSAEACALDGSETSDVAERSSGSRKTVRGRTSKRGAVGSVGLESQSSPNKKLKKTSENEDLNIEKSDAVNKKALTEKDRTKSAIVVEMDTSIDNSSYEFSDDKTYTPVVNASPKTASTSYGNVVFSKFIKNNTYNNYPRIMEPDAILNASHVELSPQVASTSSFFGGAVGGTKVTKPKQLYSNKNNESVLHRLSNASKASIRKSHRSSIKQQLGEKHKLSVSFLNHLQLEAELLEQEQQEDGATDSSAADITAEEAGDSGEAVSQPDCETPSAPEIKLTTNSSPQKSLRKLEDESCTKKDNAVPVRITRTKQRLLDKAVTPSPKWAGKVMKVQSGNAKSAKATIAQQNDSVEQVEICRTTRSKMRLKVDEQQRPQQVNVTAANFVRTPSPNRVANSSRVMLSDAKKYSAAKFKPGNVSLLGSQLKQRQAPSNLVTFVNPGGKASFVRTPIKNAQVKQEMEQQKKAEAQRLRDHRQQEALLKKENLLKVKLEEQRRKREERQHHAALAREQQQREHEEQLKRKIEAKETNSALKDAEVQRHKQRAWREAEEKRRQDEEKERQKQEEQERRRQQEEITKQRKQKEQEEVKKRLLEAKRKEQERIQREQQEMKLLREREAQRAQMLSQSNKVKAPSMDSSAATSHSSTFNTSESYDMTPQHGNKKPASDTNYDISDLQSDDETDDDEKPRKKIPFWAQGAQFKAALLQQYYAPPCFEELFGFIQTPDLSHVFTIQRKRFKARTSSAIWNSPLFGEHKMPDRRSHSICSP